MHGAAPSIVAAVDFGTFGSGYAWALKNPAGTYIPSHDINCNDQWKGADSGYPKNRSAILLGDQGETLAWGYEALNRYTDGGEQAGGFAVDFKMRLASGDGPGAGPGTAPQAGSGSGPGGRPGSGPGSTPSQAEGGRNETGRSTEHLIAAYLRELHTVARQHILRAGYGDLPISWYLSVPAIWSDFDRQVMRRAAMAAGLPADPYRLSIVLEPEAAALYCMASEARAGGFGPAGPVGVPGPAQVAGLGTPRHRPGSRFVIVDCGGGTTDLVPLTMRSDGTFDQIGVATGDTSGANRVTRQFTVSVLAERLGRPTLLHLVKAEPKAVNELMRAWEKARDVFDPAQRTPLRIELSMRLWKALPGSARAQLAATQNGENEAILLSAAQTRALLDTSVDPICALVDEQLHRIAEQASTRGPGDPDEPTAVCLVGGFANSRYLQQRLATVVEGRARLFVPPRPENAVLFGAVQYGNNPARIRSRTAARTYGYGLLDAFDPALDPPERLYLNAEKKALCKGRFRVLVRRGEIIPVGSEKTSRVYPREGNQTRMKLSFFSSDEDDPRYVDDGRVSEVGFVTIFLPDVGNRRYTARERAIDVRTIFGETVIRVQAVDLATGYQTDAEIEFTA
ncbi:hypothetical protein [Frankia sp. R82]|uniref:hypothetical protein n=1 Tax=Frankia sp. R82 TaxID=2950553 RepID=UPI00204336C0|nr:hypothetical protein [Frankia sp. R82]MCM3882809.1 hypothetical protein [Frankia sp. R82]